MADTTTKGTQGTGLPGSAPTSTQPGSTQPGSTQPGAGQRSTASPTTGGAGTGGYTGGSQYGGSAARPAREQDYGREFEHAKERAGEMVDQAKQTASDAYQKASEGVSHTYEQAIDYGRENPGKAIALAFGAGIAVGILIANSAPSSRTRSRRIVPPVMNALTEIVDELFR